MTMMEMPRGRGLRGLVLVRDLLAERGATAEELEAHAQEAERVRMQLAQLIAGPDALAQPGWGAAA
jgi:hypothetical protein